MDEQNAELNKLVKKIKKLEASGSDAARLEKLKKKLKKLQASLTETTSSKRPSSATGGCRSFGNRMPSCGSEWDTGTSKE